MGIYINPPHLTKEQWLERNGARLYSTPSMAEWREMREDNQLPVCLVQNPLFSAAAICFSSAELAAFAFNDGREKEWFAVEIEDLLEVNPELSDWL